MMAHFLHTACQGGDSHPLAPHQFRHCFSNSVFRGLLEYVCASLWE